MELMAQPVLVASIDDVLSTKLMALTEQEPDFRSVLELARSLREQIDWEFVRRRTAPSPFAAAFFTLVEALGIAPPRSGARSPGRSMSVCTLPRRGRTAVSDRLDPRDTTRRRHPGPGRRDARCRGRRASPPRRGRVAARGRAAAPRRYRAEPVEPRVVTENERVYVEDDGAVSRRVERVEQEPVRRRSGLVPALLIILAIALAAIAAAWYFTQSDTESVPSVVGLPLDDAVSRVAGRRLQGGHRRASRTRQRGHRLPPGPGRRNGARQGLARCSCSSPRGRRRSRSRTPSASARQRPATASPPSGLKANVVDVFSETSPAGEVVAQAPAAGPGREGLGREAQRLEGHGARHRAERRRVDRGRRDRAGQGGRARRRTSSRCPRRIPPEPSWRSIPPVARPGAGRRVRLNVSSGA